MPARTKSTYLVPGRGVVNTRKKTYTGKGAAPAGTRKVAPPKLSETPTVTTSPTGKVTTSGYGSKRAARRAKRAVRAARTSERRKTRALSLSRRSASQRRHRTASSEARRKSTEAAIKADRKITPAPKPAPTSKPPRYEGKKTAGTPTLRSLERAKSQGSLKVNRRGYLTTPPVRKAASTVKRLESKARSGGVLPGLTPKASRVARKVLARGDKAGATRKEKLAAAETGLVESGFENLPGGDADSAGWRQERQMYYPNPTNVKASADRFYAESRSDTGGARGRGQTAGQLAQTIQASAYPERYDERKPEANAIVKAYERGSLKPAQRTKLKRAKAQASKLGLKGLTKSKPVSKKVLTRFKAAQRAAKELEKAKLPYVWGGGHGDPASRPTGGGLDCSGAVSYVLNKMGALKGSLVSGEMGQALDPGPGAVTVFYNAGHTFMRIGNRYFGTSRSNPAGGAGFIDNPGDLSSYSVGHVPGLGKKVAVALGVPLTGGGFPGMSLSSSGTSATISEGTTQSKPGFSSKPIKLTQAQRARRTFRRLEQAGIGGDEPAPAEPSGTLAALEKKYGVKTAA